MLAFFAAELSNYLKKKIPTQLFPAVLKPYQDPT